MDTIKAYVYVIVSGLLLLAAAIFVALQWDTQRTRSTFSAYGPSVTAGTLHVILFSAAGGLVVYWMARLFLRGMRILIHEGRQKRKIASEVHRNQQKQQPEA